MASEFIPHPKPAPRKKAPKRLRPVSDKRRSKWAEREHVRLAVIARDGCCVAPARGLPGQCGWRPDRHQLEVHEVVPRGRDSTSWLDPDRAVALCPRHHDVVTEAHGPMLEVVRRAGLLLPAEPLPALHNLKEGPRARTQ